MELKRGLLDPVHAVRVWLCRTSEKSRHDHRGETEISLVEKIEQLRRVINVFEVEYEVDR